MGSLALGKECWERRREWREREPERGERGPGSCVFGPDHSRGRNDVPDLRNDEFFLSDHQCLFFP